MHSLGFSPIGFIASPYKEKFGIPRQPGLVTSVKSTLILDNMFCEESVRGLEGFSHIWLQFVFHETKEQGWKSMVRPPRLGGNKKMGVFASRSTFRPNPIGLSVVELVCVDIQKSRVVLHLKGGDLLDGTPVIDIKPYLPYVDAIPDACGGFAAKPPQKFFDVFFSEKSEVQCRRANKRLDEDVRISIRDILEQDPRPSYHQNESNIERIYSMKLYDFDLRWQYCENNKIKVLAVDEIL